MDRSPVRLALSRLARRTTRALVAAPPVRRVLARRARRAWERSGYVAFVCYGNISRSPFAEHLARAAGDRERRVVSAGRREGGRRPPQEALRAAARRGIDMRAHRSRTLDAEIIDHAEAIFVFDEINLIHMLRAHRRAAPRVHLLGAAARSGSPLLEDPWGHGQSAFESVYDRLVNILDDLSGGDLRLDRIEPKEQPTHSRFAGPWAEAPARQAA